LVETKGQLSRTVRFLREKLGKLSRIRPRPVSENTQAMGFAVEKNQAEAKEFF
jgi:hypothetical protein